MLKVSTAQQVTMLNAVNSIQQDVKRSAGVLKHNRFLTDARWSIVENLTTIAYPFKEIPKVVIYIMYRTSHNHNFVVSKLQMINSI